MQKKDTKKDKNKKREVYAIGRPSIEKLNKNEQKVFYYTLLQCAVEYFIKRDK